MVSSRRSGSVLSRMSTEPAGGSSSVLRKALAALVFIRSAPAKTAILWAASVVLRFIRSITSRVWATLMTRDFISGRIQTTSGWLREAMRRQLLQSPQASTGTPFSPRAAGRRQLSVWASLRAASSSTPRSSPRKRYAWASRPRPRLRRSSSAALWARVSLLGSADMEAGI